MRPVALRADRRLAASPAFFISAVLVLGLLVGSFLNVVIYRVPVMLERQWRAQCARAGAGRDARAGRARAALQSHRAALGLPECQAPITACRTFPS